APVSALIQRRGFYSISCFDPYLIRFLNKLYKLQEIKLDKYRSTPNSRIMHFPQESKLLLPVWIKTTYTLFLKLHYVFLLEVCIYNRLDLGFRDEFHNFLPTPKFLHRLDGCDRGKRPHFQTSTKLP